MGEKGTDTRTAPHKCPSRLDSVYALPRHFLIHTYIFIYTCIHIYAGTHTTHTHICMYVYLVIRNDNRFLRGRIMTLFI